MAKRKIVWSHRAKIRLFEILTYYAERNKSKVYSQKIYYKLSAEISKLAKHPELGLKSEMDNIRGLIVGNYILFYEISDKSIIIHTIWDCRQNPEDLIIK